MGPLVVQLGGQRRRESHRFPSGSPSSFGAVSIRRRNATCSVAAEDRRERRHRIMDPVKLLKKQHREVEALFKRVGRAEGASERRRLMDEIGAKLTLHTKIEEEIFYPVLREVPSKKAEEMVLEAYEEHHVVKLVLAELPKVDPEDERFEAKMTVLEELVEHHVEEEEDEMFKLADKIDDDELESLGERMAPEAEQAEAVLRNRHAAWSRLRKPAGALEGAC